MPQPAETRSTRRAGSVIRHVRPRFWAETVLGTLTFLTFALTLVSRDWIEVVFRVDPDQHSGSLEWLIVGVLAVISATLFVLARMEWRRAAAALVEAGA